MADAANCGQVVRVPFKPWLGARSAHAQTMAPAFFRPTPPLAFRVERLEMPDGDFIYIAHSGAQTGPIAILVHGLGGGFESKYLRGTARKLLAAGWRTVTIQLRGAGKHPNRMPRTYHHGDTADLRYVWWLLRGRYPDVPMAAVGWSLGGNVLMKAVAEEGAACPVQWAVAASVPFRLQECVEFLDAGFARVYQDHLLTYLKAMIKRKVANGTTGGADVARALAARNFTEFDTAWTAPLNGFDSAKHYYQVAASGQYLRNIAIPTLIVHALDDPLMVPQIVPKAEQLAASVRLELTERGGHVGFIGSDPRGRPAFWLEDRIAQWLHSGYCDLTHSQKSGMLLR